VVRLAVKLLLLDEDGRAIAEDLNQRFDGVVVVE